MLCTQSLSRVQLFETPMDCRPSGSSVRGDSPSKNTGVGCHALLQGIFPTQGSNPGLPNCRRILYRLSHQGSAPRPPRPTTTHTHFYTFFFFPVLFFFLAIPCGIGDLSSLTESPALEVGSLKHWTSREFIYIHSFWKCSFLRIPWWTSG